MQIVKDYETRSALNVIIVLWYNFAKTDVVPQYGQLLCGNRRPLTVTPDHSNIEILFGARVKVLQDSYKERWLLKPLGPVVIQVN